MGFVGSMFGTTSGDQGSAGANFSANQANLLQPTTVAQSTQAYNASQDALNQQAAFMNALKAQNGIQNQSDVYNQMQGVANGTGPNPAAAMLANSTGANVANQAALMAGQRGVGANPALLARQAAMQGANIQQNAAGQGAAMQANQSLNAMNAAGNIAGQQVGNLAGATQGYNQAAQSEQQNLLGSIAALNNASTGSQNSVNSANGQVANTVAGSQMKAGYGAINGAATGMAMAKGGVVPRYADGGAVAPKSKAAGFLYGSAPSSEGGGPSVNAMGQPMNNGKGDDIESTAGNNLGAAAHNGMASLFTSNPSVDPDMGSATAMSGGPMEMMEAAGPEAAMMAAKGGKVPAMLSPGEKYLDPRQARDVAKGKANPMEGKTVPGQAKVKGDSLKNDTVPAKLDPGGVVIPRHVMQSDDPAKNAAAFVAAVLKKQALGSKRK